MTCAICKKQHDASYEIFYGKRTQSGNQIFTKIRGSLTIPLCYKCISKRYENKKRFWTLSSGIVLLVEIILTSIFWDYIIREFDSGEKWNVSWVVFVWLPMTALFFLVSAFEFFRFKNLSPTAKINYIYKEDIGSEMAKGLCEGLDEIGLRFRESSGIEKYNHFLTSKGYNQWKNSARQVPEDIQAASNIQAVNDVSGNQVIKNHEAFERYLVMLPVIDMPFNQVKRLISRDEMDQLCRRGEVRYVNGRARVEIEEPDVSISVTIQRISQDVFAVISESAGPGTKW